MKVYIYDGPVMEFGTCICNRWYGETTAISESKAKSNLSFRYKKEHNKIAGTRITLPGKLQILEEK